MRALLLPNGNLLVLVEPRTAGDVGADPDPVAEIYQYGAEAVWTHEAVCGKGNGCSKDCPDQRLPLCDGVSGHK